LHRSFDYFFFACARADPAADLDAALVLPSLSTADAEVAAFADVTFGGETWDSELPAALLDALPVEALESTLEDLLATLELVTFVAMNFSSTKLDVHTVTAVSGLGKGRTSCFRSARRIGCPVRPNVRANLQPAAWRQAQAAENGFGTCGLGLVTCRWLSG
jgi:hypothetical protein